MRRVVMDAFIAMGVAAVAALAFNAARPGAIPLVAERDYEILVACPEPGGQVEVLEPAAAASTEPGWLWIDARSAGEHAAWHLPGALSVPFDYLESAPAATVRRIASSGARRVLVYGDGKIPDSGHELARELSGAGIRNVAVIRGGAPALRGGAL